MEMKAARERQSPHVYISSESPAIGACLQCFAGALSCNGALCAPRDRFIIAISLRAPDLRARASLPTFTNATKQNTRTRT